MTIKILCWFFKIFTFVKVGCPPSNFKISKKIFSIIPLPLLVSEGNERGGGDYYGNNKELCGTWARDCISVEKTIPDDFVELKCDFYEE